MERITRLNPFDHYKAQALAQAATDWFRLFECLRPNPPSPTPTLSDKLEIIAALHRMTEFCTYIAPFRTDDTRMDAFEDTVAEAVYKLSLAKAVQE